MIKKETRFYDLYNYRNSKYFIQTVKEVRRYDKNYNRNTVNIIFNIIYWYKYYFK